MGVKARVGWGLWRRGIDELGIEEVEGREGSNDYNDEMR